MKASISRIGLLSIVLASSALAQTGNENFPAPGRTDNVTWAKDARVGKAQIKVLRKGDGSWIFVEYSHHYLPSLPPQPVPPSGEKPPKPPEWVKSDVDNRAIWINTQWLVDASEINVGN